MMGPIEKAIIAGLLLVYLFVLVVVGAWNARSLKGFSDFAVAGRRQGGVAVLMSVLATIIGASTTMGIVDTACRIGFPAVWWLLWGCVGLVAQALVLSGRFRDLQADTLPEVARITVGRGAERLLAAVICIAWIGVIAGQFTALRGVIEYLLGLDSNTSFLIVSAVVIGYTALGGQWSVVRTDMVQLPLILVGVVLTCVYLFCERNWTALMQLEWVNSEYGAGDQFRQMLVIGGVYFLGPDILSRSLIAKDGRTARRAVLAASVVLAFFAVAIVLVGVWARVSQIGDRPGVLLRVLEGIPLPLMILLSLALVSALLSSLDTCLVNAASILTKDLLGRESVAWGRAAVVGMGLLALGFTLGNRGDIIALLTGAYSIYAPGVICPMLVAVLCHGRHPIRKCGWLAAVAVGGLCGVAGICFPAHAQNLPVVGMALSLAGALAAVQWRSPCGNAAEAAPDGAGTGG